MEPQGSWGCCFPRPAPGRAVRRAEGSGAGGQACSKWTVCGIDLPHVNKSRVSLGCSRALSHSLRVCPCTPPPTSRFWPERECFMPRDVSSPGAATEPWAAAVLPLAIVGIESPLELLPLQRPETICVFPRRLCGLLAQRRPRVWGGRTGSCCSDGVGASRGSRHLCSFLACLWDCI